MLNLNFVTLFQDKTKSKMSAIAEFRIIEKTKLEELQKAAEIIIKRKLFSKKLIDNYPEYLKSNSDELEEFDGSGFVFGNLIAFLEENKGINFQNEEFDPIAFDISRKRKNTTIIFTNKNREEFSSKLDVQNFSEEELVRFNTEFIGDNDPEFAKAELRGIETLKRNLDLIKDDNSVLLLTIM